MAWIVPAVLGITSLVAQNSANKSAIANNDNQNAVSVANAKAARDQAQATMNPWLAHNAGPFANASPGHPVGPGGVPMGGAATPITNTQRTTMPVARSTGAFGAGGAPPTTVGAVPGAQPGAPQGGPQPALAMTPQAPMGGTPLPQPGMPAQTQLTPEQIALFHQIMAARSQPGMAA